MKIGQGGTSGFGWDPKSKCIVADKAIWNEYLRTHPKASKWRGKECPFYEDLCTIFGNDRALGQDAQGPEEMEKEVNEDEEDLESREEPQASSTQPHQSSSIQPSVETGFENSRNSNKRARGSEGLVKGLSEVATILGKEIRAASSEISKAVGFEVGLSEKRSKLNEELSKFDLTVIERHRATRKIAADPETIDIFFSIPDAEKEEWVRALLRGEI